MATNRRELLCNLAGLGASATLGGWAACLNRPQALRAAEADATPRFVRLEPDLEPLVRLIEETPREKCFDMITAQLRDGLSYRRFLAALFLAGVRNVNPRPPGFDLHCVFVVQAAHQLSLDSPTNERLLPLYWALDEFKNSQAKDAKKPIDFRLEPIAGKLPTAEKAWTEFHDAMDAWDMPRAERAVVVLYRTAGAGQIGEALWRLGARDYRNIGHKAIFTANAWRTLETIGWRHAEPVLRSLVLGLLDFGAENRVNEYAYADQAYHGNLRRVDESFDKLPATWASGPAAESATLVMLDRLREGDVDAACDYAVDALRRGRANNAALWDAVHLAAGEQMMRQPGVLGIHTVTSTSALRYASQATTEPTTRLLMLLQAIGWVCQFHKALAARDEKRYDIRITELDDASLPSSPDEALAAVFDAVDDNLPAAAKLAMAYGKQVGDGDAFTAAARPLIFAKATDPHGYKYPAAVFEDLLNASPKWRPHLLATSTYYLPGTGTPDAPLMQRAREAVASLG